MPNVRDVPASKASFQYACPFRKHTPQKYNMYQHQSCALGSFGSIARVKEHLYRRHMAPIQCVRCWLFFKDQDKLNIHLSVANICERRDGQLAEGITPSIEKRLRIRKRKSGDQTHDDRWGDIYRILFPEDEVPSPFYEPVQDDVAQPFEPVEISIVEFMRQEVPEIFTTRLQSEVNSMFLEETGLQDDPAHLRGTFIERMRNLISDAQDIAVQTYRQRYSGDSSQSNRLMTPAPSSSSGSFPVSQQQPRHFSLQNECHSISESKLALPSPPELEGSYAQPQEQNATTELSQPFENFEEQNLTDKSDTTLDWDGNYIWQGWPWEDILQP